MKKLVIAGLFMAASVCHGQDQSADFSHFYELTASDTALTLAGFKITDSISSEGRLTPAVPIMVLGVDALYRSAEPNQWGEFLHYDVPGVAIGCLFEILFTPAKKN